VKALVCAFNQEKTLVGAFSVIVKPIVEPMDRFTAQVFVDIVTALLYCLEGELGVLGPGVGEVSTEAGLLIPRRHEHEPGPGLLARVGVCHTAGTLHLEPAARRLPVTL